MESNKRYRGEATTFDGRRITLSEDEVKSIWEKCEADKAKREENMPSTKEALDTLHSARERLRELGWSSAVYCPKDGSGFAVIEFGSTGIFPAIYHGEWPANGMQVDHINGAKDDNRISNLRVVTHSQNLHNQRRAQSGSSTGFLGVRRDKGKYQSMIQADGSRKYLGRFDTAEEAHAAYVSAKRKLHGIDLERWRGV